MEEEDGVGGVPCAGFGGNPPAGELWLSGFGVIELDLLIRRAWRCGDGARWMKDELPAPLVEEQAEGSVGADGRDSEHDAQC